MVELVDTLASGASALQHEGSSPSSDTNNNRFCGYFFIGQHFNYLAF